MAPVINLAEVVPGIEVVKAEEMLAQATVQD
jgi:hypothetical protein